MILVTYLFQAFTDHYPFVWSISLYLFAVPYVLHCVCFKKENGCSVVKSIWSLSYSVVLESGLVQTTEPTGKCQVLVQRQKTGEWGSLGWSLIGVLWERCGKAEQGVWDWVVWTILPCFELSGCSPGLAPGPAMIQGRRNTGLVCASLGCEWGYQFRLGWLTYERRPPRPFAMKKLTRPVRDNLPGISNDFKMPKNFKM
jgi:hypothetical protein